MKFKFASEFNILIQICFETLLAGLSEGTNQLSLTPNFLTALVCDDVMKFSKVFARNTKKSWQVCTTSQIGLIGEKQTNGDTSLFYPAPPPPPPQT